MSFPNFPKTLLFITATLLPPLSLYIYIYIIHFSITFTIFLLHKPENMEPLPQSSIYSLPHQWSLSHSHIIFDLLHLHKATTPPIILRQHVSAILQSLPTHDLSFVDYSKYRTCSDQTRLSIPLTYTSVTLSSYRS